MAIGFNMRKILKAIFLSLLYSLFIKLNLGRPAYQNCLF
jgi:hypothetical protein